MYASASMNRTSARPGKRDNVQRTGARGYLAIFLFVIAGCTTTNSKTQIDKMLDDWHDAAAKSDESRYFAHFADNAVFLGTDATERWNVPAFRAYAHPYFLQGKGWAFHAIRRNITVADSGYAWFDEALETKNLGPARGSGVLLKGPDGVWKIAQYNLSITIPNERFAEVKKTLETAAPPNPK